MRLILFLTFVLYAQISASGQETVMSVKRPKLIVKGVPSALFNVSNSALQGGIEYQLYKRFTLSHEFGILLNSGNDYPWRRGYRHLSEARLYINRYERPGGNLFIGAQFRYWAFRAVDESDFCRLDCLFRQTIRYEIDRTGIGANISFGLQQDFLDDRIILELGGSFGFIDIENQTNVPEDAELREFNFFVFDFLNNRDRWTNYSRRKGSVLINFRVGYILK